MLFVRSYRDCWFNWLLENLVCGLVYFFFYVCVVLLIVKMLCQSKYYVIKTKCTHGGLVDVLNFIMLYITGGF